MTAPAEVRHALNVDRGVALLDAKLGRDVWLPRLDLNTLDVSSSDRCVACQVTGIGWYGEALEALGVTLDAMYVGYDSAGSWTEAHGFGLKWHNTTKVRDFAGLTQAWVDQVEQLRSEEP